MGAYFRCWTDAAEMKSLKVQDSICGIVAIFFIIRSFRFQFVPTLSNIDFQLLVFFFFFRRLETLFSMSNSMSLFQVFTKSRNSFRLSATNCISQRGTDRLGFFVHTLTTFETWFIGLPAGLAGKQLLIRKSHERVRLGLPSVCVQFYWTQCSVKYTTTTARKVNRGVQNDICVFIYAVHTERCNTIFLVVLL